MAPDRKARAKRAAAAEARARNKASIRTFAPDQKADPSKISLLLDLPPELRTTIYEIVIANTRGVHLCYNSAKYPDLAISSQMLYINKQLYNEFSYAFLLADIHTTAARNYDFRHIVTFLNRPSDEEVRALPTMVLPQRRNIIIDLTYSGRFTKAIMPPLLRRWIRRADSSTKKGTQVRYQYRVMPGYSAWLAMDFRAGEWKKEAEKMPEGRMRDELLGIVDALQRRVR